MRISVVPMIILYTIVKSKHLIAVLASGAVLLAAPASASVKELVDPATVPVQG